MQDWKWYPEDAQGEKPDAGADEVCENHAAAGASARRGAAEAFVHDFVEAVEDGADADDEVAESA